MDFLGYFKSLSMEIDSQRDRVRQLLGEAHWPTDGGWKESFLRSVLRRVVGQGVVVGTGFFDFEGQVSPQVDLLVYRADSPVRFRDGDLVVVPANAVLAVVEVKTRLTYAQAFDALDHVARAGERLGRHRRNVLLGLFAYETQFETNRPVLKRLRSIGTDYRRVVDLVAHGPGRFVKYWHEDPDHRPQPGEKWYSYHLPRLAFGYFIQNLVSHLSPNRVGGYPQGGKEPQRDGSIYATYAAAETQRLLGREEGSVSPVFREGN